MRISDAKYQPPVNGLRKIAVTATATPQNPVWFNQSGKLTAIFQPTVNCYIKFGVRTSTVATTNDYKLVAGLTYAFNCNLGNTHFSVIRQSSDGEISWFVPGANIPTISAPPLPPNLVDYYLSTNINPGTLLWSSALGVGPGLSAVGAPTLAVDPGFFNGYAVGQGNRTGSAAWKGTAGATLFANGSRPYCCSVIRCRSLNPTNNTLEVLVGTSLTTTLGLRLYNNRDAFGSQSWRGSTFSTSAQSASAPNTNIHFMETWSDASNMRIRVDGVLSNGVASTIGVNCTTISIGISPTASNQFSDASHAFHLWCTAYPGDAAASALRTWAIQQFGI